MVFKNIADEPLRPDVVIVPGRAFDLDGNRLGRGLGCYDRWLSENPDVPTIGVAFDAMMCNRGVIAMEEHDQQVQHVVYTVRRDGVYQVCPQTI